MFVAGQVATMLKGDFNGAAFGAFDAANHKSAGAMVAAEKKMKSSAERSAATLHRVGHVMKMGLAGGVVAFGAAVVKSVSLAANFEQQLSSLKSVSGATSTQMHALKTSAMDAGAATKFSALDAAKAQTELAKGGLSVSKILGGGLRGALSLAAAGELELADAAATTANALNLFGLSGGQAEHVADALAMAANTTTADVHDFSMALTQGGAAAKNVGLSLDETVVVLEALAQAGVKGSDAGTSMKAAFTQIASPTDKSAEAMKRLGLEFFTASGTMKSLPAVARELDDAFGGLTDQQRLATAKTIAGTDGMRALLALYDASPQSLRVYADQLRRQGTAAEVAAQKQDNFKGKLENFKGSVETAGIAIGSKLLPGLTSLAERATDTINRLGETGQLDKFAAGLVSGFGTAGQVLGDIARQGAGAANVLLDIGRALDLADPAKLEAIAASFVAFKAAGTVAPMIATLGSALATLALNARTAPTVGKFFAEFTRGISPITGVAIAAAALAGALVYLSAQESSEEAAARSSAAAKRAQKDAFDALANAERASVDAKFAAQRSTLDLARAEEHLDAVRKDPKASVGDLKEAELGVAEARKASADAHRTYTQQLEKEAAASNSVVDAAFKRVVNAQDELDKAEKRLSSNQRDPRFEQDVVEAEKRYADALRDVASATNAAGIAALNRQRIEAGRKAVTPDNAEGFRLAQALTAGLPKEIRTRYILDDQDALAKVGLLGIRLRAMHGQKVVTQILAKAESAQSAVGAFGAALAGVKPTVITRILTTAKTAAVEVQAFKAIAAGLPPAKVLKITSSAASEKTKLQSLQGAIAALRDKNVKVTAQTAAAQAALRSINNADVHAKVLRILGNNSSAAAKVRQIVALGIPAKTARILGEAGQAIAAANATAAAINAVPSNKTSTITVTHRDVWETIKKGASGGRAAGKAPGSGERALIGEGAGPEAVGNPVDGWAWVTRPTIWDLGPRDAVIPFEAAMSGRALGLMAGMLGIPGYKKGKKPPKPLPIPDAVKYGAVSEDELGKQRDSAREAYQKRKDRVHDLDVDIREQRTKVRAAKGPAKTKARAKLRDLQADRRRYANGGRGVPNSLAELRAQWTELKRQFSALHKTNLEIERLNKQQETDRTKMATASKRGDEGGWRTARDHRAGILSTLRDMYARAVGLAKPDSNFRAELEGQLASIEGEIADAAGSAFERDETETPAQAAARAAAERLADTGMTDAEREQLARLEANQALAGLTATLDDDKAAAGGIASFLEGILGAVQADPSRGGAPAIRDIADRLKQARDNAASFTGGGPGNASQDLQAQLDQANERARVSAENARINEQALRVFQGWQGGMQRSAAAGPSITINTLHPGDSRTLAAIGEAATAGHGQQAAKVSPRTFLGL